MPQDRVFDALERLHGELADVRRVLIDAATSSMRLVLTPESVVVAEARRTLASLTLYGYSVDAVIANRVFPAGSEDSWRAGWVAAQSRQLADVEATFAPLPVYRSSFRAGEPVGVEELAAFAAEAYGSGPRPADPFAVASVGELVAVDREDDRFVLSIALPLADRRDVHLARKGDELVVTVGSHRRLISLPSALRRCEVAGASLRDGRLHVAFLPDPRVWMRS
jgi:arsenite-transporting ATPase